MLPRKCPRTVPPPQDRMSLYLAQSVPRFAAKALGRLLEPGGTWTSASDEAVGKDNPDHSAPSGLVAKSGPRKTPTRGAEPPPSEPPTPRVGTSPLPVPRSACGRGRVLGLPLWRDIGTWLDGHDGAG